MALLTVVIDEQLKSIEGQYKEKNSDFSEFKLLLKENELFTRGLIELLGKALETKTLGELCEFIPIEERIPFFKAVFDACKKNGGLFKQIGENSKKMQAFYGADKDFIPLFVYGIADKYIDIDLSVKHAAKDSPDLQKNDIYSLFDKSSFFATEWAYDKFISKAEVYGREQVVEVATKTNTKPPVKKNVQWVMPTNEAQKIEKEIRSSKDSEGRKEVYAKKVGLKVKDLDEEANYYCINLDGKAIKEVVDCSMGLPNRGTLGANDFWVPGGFTSGGTPEMVVNCVPRKEPFLISEDRRSFEK